MKQTGNIIVKSYHLESGIRPFCDQYILPLFLTFENVEIDFREIDKTPFNYQIEVILSCLCKKIGFQRLAFSLKIITDNPDIAAKAKKIIATLNRVETTMGDFFESRKNQKGKK